MDRDVAAMTLGVGDRVVVTDESDYGATNSIIADKRVYRGLVGTIMQRLTCGVVDTGGDMSVVWDDPDCNDANDALTGDEAWVYVNVRNVEPHIPFTTIEDVEAFLAT